MRLLTDRSRLWMFETENQSRHSGVTP